MAKINLLTLHYSDNNGAVLQTYATCEILRRLGHEVTLINLQDRSVYKRYFQQKYHIKLIPRYVRFAKFTRKHYARQTSRMFEINTKLLPKCDYTVCGSDQIWNPDIVFKIQKNTYFLDFVNDGSKKIALASSFGKAKWEADENETNLVRNLLQDFSAISVREASGVDICRDTFGVDAVSVVDPTLALNDFSGIIDSEPNIKDEIRFFLFKQTYSVQVIDYLIEKTGLVGRNIGYEKAVLAKYQNLNFRKQTPKEWLEGIRDSRIFLSDSFHGIACSIILHKQFIALCADVKKFERISSLLKMFGLENRIVYNFDDVKERFDELMQPIDYRPVDALLEQKQMEYFDFVRKNIN